MGLDARKAKPGQTISVAEPDGSVTTLKAKEGKGGEWVMRPRTQRQAEAADRFGLSVTKADKDKPDEADDKPATHDDNATVESQKEE